MLYSLLNDSTLIVVNNYSNNHSYLYFLLSAYTIIEYSVFAYFIYAVLESKVFKKIIIFATVGFYLFALIYLFKSKYSVFDSLPASIESILIVSYCIFYLFDQLNKPQVIFIYQEPSFWFVVGLMVYLSGTLFLFIQADQLSVELRNNFWKINFFANIVKNILFAIAFSTKKNKVTINALENPFEPDYEHNLFENPYKS